MSDDNRSTVEITLLGRSFVIACPPDQEAGLQRAARYLDRALQGVQAHSPTMATEKVALMAALNISHELLQARDENQAREAQLERLDQRLARALGDAAPSS